MSELIDKALADCGDTDVVVMGRNVLEETGRVFKELFGDAKVIIIADENTWPSLVNRPRHPSRRRSRDCRTDDLPRASSRLRLLRER